MKKASVHSYFVRCLFVPLVLSVAVPALCWGSEPVLHVIRATQEGSARLKNGDFEQTEGGRPSVWDPAANGCAVVAEGRNQSHALAATNHADAQWSGARQVIVLNRTTTSPIVVRGWSKALDVSGSPDSGYSLYVDIVYDDGTPLWGQTANFPTGTHDWVKREILILPQKPVKSLTLNCILRGHSGAVLFDDVTVQELPDSGGNFLFQGVPVRPTSTAPVHTETVSVIRSGDGIEVIRAGDSIQLHQPKPARGPSAPGFFVRDVAADSDFYDFHKGRCEELNLALDTSFVARDNCIEVSGKVCDLTGKDRVVCLVFALPIGPGDWTWGDDIRRSRPATGGKEYANLTSVPCGAPGAMSLYPIAPVFSDKAGLAIGVDPEYPAVYRLGYHAGLKLLFMAWDFGLVPETRNFPSSAKFRFVFFQFENRWGFRGAFAKYMKVFPEAFKVRSKEQGIWMPFTDISTVQGWRDFGFRYHEGDNRVSWDEVNGILSFRYTEPMTWWMRMPKGVPRTFENAVRQRDALAANGNGIEQQRALIAKTAAMVDDSGQPALLFRNEPWCDGAVWSLNPNPFLPGAGLDRGDRAEGVLNGATLYWNAKIKDALYGPNAKGRRGGEYLDSIEGYVTADLNFRRDHFASSTVPLTFSRDDRRPALFKGLAVYEFTRWLSDDVHQLEKLMFANGVPYRFGFLCPLLDVLGTETDWVRDRRYVPPSHAQMSYWRTLSGAKPYLLLMNTDYDTFTPDMVEHYFQRSLFYGMFPSMFSHNAAENPYWQNPKWYNRDRPLFKKYLPVIKRVAEAGWQPVTLAESSNPRILVERFGSDSVGGIYLTLFNDSPSVEQVAIKLDRKALGLSGSQTITELPAGSPGADTRNPYSVTLQPGEARVLALTSAR